MQAQEMAREKQINFRVSDEEAARFDLVAEHYGLAVSASIRMLVKREAEQIGDARATKPAQQDDFRWDAMHTHILEIVDSARDPIDSGDIGAALARVPYSLNANVVGVGVSLNQLRRNGYLRRLKSGYVITPKGKEALS
jgi:hypothetical protein